MHKLFDIQINDKLHPVYNIPNKHHKYGEWNGCPTEWWLYRGDLDNLSSRGLLTEFANSNSEDFIPYIDKGTHRVCWEINYKQNNSIRHKHDSADIRSHGRCKLIANGKEVYSFPSSDINYAMSKVQQLVCELMQHPYNFLNPEEDNGRKIFFYGLPAFVRTGYEPGEIRIAPDYECISREEWWEKYKFYDNNSMSKFSKKVATKFDGYDEDEYDDEDFPPRDGLNSNDEINWGDALSDGKIWWFRK